PDLAPLLGDDGHVANYSEECVCEIVEFGRSRLTTSKHAEVAADLDRRPIRRALRERQEPLLHCYQRPARVRRACNPPSLEPSATSEGRVAGFRFALVLERGSLAWPVA